MRTQKKDLLLKLGFILLPFNNFPKIEIFDNVFYLSFLWAIVFVMTNIIKTMGIKSLKISKYYKVTCIFLFYIILRNLLVFYEAIYREEILLALKNIFYYSIWILTSIFLYNILKNRNDLEKENFLKLTLKSFYITGIIEVLNFIFKFYERNYSEAYGILRINPLSSESSYYNLNIVFFIFVILYLKDKKKLKRSENIMLILIISIIFLTFSSTGFFIIAFLILFYFFKLNISKKIIFCIICTTLFFNLNYLKNIENEYLNKIQIQMQKIIQYGLGKESDDYSTNIRKKVREIYGKNLFKKHMLTGNGTTGIYRISKFTGYGIENKINSDAKNLYWTILAQEGMIGGIFYFSLFFSIYFNIKKTNELREYFLFGYLAFLLMLNTYNNIWVQSLWIIYPLVLSYNKNQ